MPLGSNRELKTRSTDAPSGLSQQIQNSVPSCAQECLSSYVSQEYFCSPNDFQCLCTTYSSQGFTIGELALICDRTHCGALSTDEQVDSYNVCSGVSGFASATHKTLTTPALTTSTTLPTSAQNPTISPTPNNSGSASSTASRSQGGSGLTSAQAVGVSIAASGTLVIAILLIYLVICIRRRKGTKPRRDRKFSYDFVDDTPPHETQPWNEQTYLRGPLGQLVVPRAELSAEKRSMIWSARDHRSSCFPWQSQSQSRDRGMDKQSIDGRPVSSDSHYSDCSNTSNRTVSQLLPAKPSGIPIPLPRKLSLQKSLYSHTTIFEEPKSLPITSRYSQQLSQQHPAEREKVLARQQPQCIDAYTRSSDQTRQPPLSLAIPPLAPRSSAIRQVFGGLPLPPLPVAKTLADARGGSTYSRAASTGNEVDIIDYYAESDSPELYYTTPIDEEWHIKRAAPTLIKIAKPTYPPKVIARNSKGSDCSRRTSFESSDPTEATPPEEEEEKQLTPIIDYDDATATGSPIAGIRYPKVPRSSSQAVPRSPSYQVPPLRLPDRESQKKYIVASPATPERQALTQSPTPLGGMMPKGDTGFQDLSSIPRESRYKFRVPAQQPRGFESPLKGHAHAAAASSPELDWPLKRHIGSDFGTGRLSKVHGSPLCCSEKKMRI